MAKKISNTFTYVRLIFAAILLLIKIPFILTWLWLKYIVFKLILIYTMRINGIRWKDARSLASSLSFKNHFSFTKRIEC